ncbi:MULTISPECIES: FAD-dependent oxidoreductase [unclassified Streptomyces]|uniref:FAD-dependent oxidoreductase n=1 Tax=unclassified Streptomyces TaxID=2593676 RepID=UPI000CD5850A|nr:MULTISPECIES: FAD-dependent oxidoreductase [unclassified Streptomyces]
MTTTPSVAVVGGGWSGCTAARLLLDRGYRVHLYERDQQLGGHSRSEVLGGVVFEPNGPHIFHTSNRAVADFVGQYAIGRPFEHRVLTEIFLEDEEEPRYLAWPPQVDQLRELPLWPRIEKELENLPATPSTANFQEYSESVMGPTLYGLFVREYTVKQWGREPHELSADFAPKRLDLRTDGNTRLFRDRWEFFPERGFQEVIEQIARPVPVTVGATLGLTDLEELAREHQAVVVTAALDDFAGRPDALEWRGIRTVSRYVPVDDPAATLTPGYQVNRPSLRRPYTRTIETKHATGQRIGATVVSEEYPGAPHRHYPVPTVDSRNERLNDSLKREIRDAAPLPVFFCGRLANYLYINQDEAIAQAMACAEEVDAFLASAGGGTEGTS